jgi:head-tail adaptor
LLACSGFLLSLGLGRRALTSAIKSSSKTAIKSIFAQFSEEFGRGFVADGNEIRSKTTRCTIKSRREVGDTIDFHVACASEIMASSIQLKIKILNSNSVSRVFQDPDFEGMELTFYRCAM